MTHLCKTWNKTNAESVAWCGHHQETQHETNCTLVTCRSCLSNYQGMVTQCILSLDHEGEPIGGPQGT